LLKSYYFLEKEEPQYLKPDYTQTAKDKTARCKSCFKLRLEKAHYFALENKFDFFTTTLLVSPYQDQDVIEEIGNQISSGTKTQFLFCDFRLGFRQTHAKAKELNLYCQKYCGCLASLKERNKEKEERKIRC